MTTLRSGTRPVGIRWTRAAEQGTMLVEYAMLVGLIALVAMAAVMLLGEVTYERLSSIAQTVTGP